MERMEDIKQLSKQIRRTSRASYEESNTRASQEVIDAWNQNGHAFAAHLWCKLAETQMFDRKRFCNAVNGARATST
eukprot:2102977-Pyramimonas_sp.AAC.1